VGEGRAKRLDDRDHITTIWAEMSEWVNPASGVADDPTPGRKQPGTAEPPIRAALAEGPDSGFSGLAHGPKTPVLAIGPGRHRLVRTAKQVVEHDAADIQGKEFEGRLEKGLTHRIRS